MFTFQFPNIKFIGVYLLRACKGELFSDSSFKYSDNFHLLWTTVFNRGIWLVTHADQTGQFIPSRAQACQEHGSKDYRIRWNILFLPFAISASYYPFMLLNYKLNAAEKLLRGTDEPDRSQQHSSAEDPAVPSDTEPDQDHNHWLVLPPEDPMNCVV